MQVTSGLSHVDFEGDFSFPWLLFPGPRVYVGDNMYVVHRPCRQTFTAVLWIFLLKSITALCHW